ncbi:UNVERIFIED_CONTAM: Transposon TX1 uncharacterized protein [Sesamum indicum]
MQPHGRGSMLNLAVWNVRGLNKRDHQLALKDLVSEYRLHFLGILETRVRISNVMHIQSFLLPQWKWFVDYASVGNRIWIAWDDNLLDVHILDLGEQFIHYRITIKALHESCIITIAYDVSEMIDRRTLWHTLGTLAPQCSNDPWLVGGNINAVRDLNEVCGISGDIRIATEEFNNGIQEAGLLPLPMQGECLSFMGIHRNIMEVFRQQKRNKGDLTRNVQLAKGFLDEAQTLVSSNRQNELFLYLEHCCRMVYAKAAKTEQIMLQQRAKMQWMKDGDQCSRVFFRKIAQRRATRRILQINDEHGTTHTDPGEVVHEFVSYYQNLLGEDKAPGPDGYSSGFYKAAWPVVGAEVTRAVLDFFSTGRLLKQVNSTLLGRLPPRCALKVDIRKAYDTVEWDFLVATLQLFGFPPTFTRWIEECISTTSFSVGLNGTPHEFFVGARGLRQGDPLSPFLFVLVMEVLHIDDLLLFCRADLDSVRVLKERKDQLLSILGFQEGHLPMRYLGLPLISSRLTISDCQPLLFKIDARIAGWEGMSLSYAGRVQIIKSVLSTLNIYWASAFILPKAIIKEVEKRLRRFLWKGTSMTGYAKVAWKDVCKPVGEGGQGIKDIDALNRALMTKKLCDIIRCDRTSIWVEWLQRGRLQNNSIWIVDEKGGSWGWRKLLRLCSLIQPMVECRIGDWRTFYLWKDPWHHLGPLIYRFPRASSLLGLDESTKLNMVIDEGQWHWPLITDLECLQIIYTLPRFMMEMIESFGVSRVADPQPKPCTDLSARLDRKSVGLHYFRKMPYSHTRNHLIRLAQSHMGNVCGMGSEEMEREAYH